MQDTVLVEPLVCLPSKINTDGDIHAALLNSNQFSLGHS